MDTTVPTLLAEIKKRLSGHGLEAIDLMDEVDPRRVGRISRTQFERLLNSRVVQFSAREITPLEIEVASPDKPNEINGSRFLKALENAGARLLGGALRLSAPARPATGRALRPHAALRQDPAGRRDAGGFCEGGW
jgi:hypothetical protein